jgi:hypothetical protein
LPSDSEPYGITAGSDKNIWFTEYGTSKIGKLLTSKSAGTTYGHGPGYTVEYHVPLSGTGLPTMTKTEVEKWGEKEEIPAEATATAILPPNKPMGWPATAYTGATIYYQDSSEQTVNVSSPTGGISTTEYNSHNDITRTLSADDRAAALKEGKSAEVAEKLSTKNTYNTEGTELESTLGPEHEVKLQGTAEPIKARKSVKYTYDQGAPSEGGPYELVTSTTEAAKLANGEEKEPRTTSDSYSGQEGLGWKLREPTSTTTSPSGPDLTHKTIYSSSTGEVLETMMPAASGKSKATGNEGAHDSEIIYYAPENESSVAICNKHPEWADLPCQTQPAHQPEVAGFPELPVTTYTYNIWLEPEVTKSTSGSETRTETDSYDNIGRLTSKETTSTTGTSLPKINYEYSKETGALVKQSDTVEGGEQWIKNVFNKLGQLSQHGRCGAGPRRS